MTLLAIESSIIIEPQTLTEIHWQMEFISKKNCMLKSLMHFCFYDITVLVKNKELKEENQQLKDHMKKFGTNG